MAASWDGKTDWNRKAGTIFALACAGLLALSPARAQPLPGEGRTIRIAVGDTLGALLKYQDDIARMQGDTLQKVLKEATSEN